MSASGVGTRAHLYDRFGSGIFGTKIKCDRFGSDCSEKKCDRFGSVQTMFLKKCVHDRFGSEKNVIGSDLLGFLVKILKYVYS